jgi:hypothetical protein
MYVRVTSIPEPVLDIHLLDFIGTGDIEPLKIDLSRINQLFPMKIDISPDSPFIPTDEDLKAIKAALTFANPAIGDGVYAICFLVHYIFTDVSSIMSGFRFEVKSHQLPIGAGLGSSAAFSVALSGALLRMRALQHHEWKQFSTMPDDYTRSDFSESTYNLELINKWAFGTAFTLLLYYD